MPPKKKTSGFVIKIKPSERLAPTGEIHVASAQILRRDLTKKDGTPWHKYRLSGKKEDGKKFSLIVSKAKAEHYKTKYGLTIVKDTSPIKSRFKHSRKLRECKGGSPQEDGCDTGYRAVVSRKTGEPKRCCVKIPKKKSPSKSPKKKKSPTKKTSKKKKGGSKKKEGHSPSI